MRLEHDDETLKDDYGWRTFRSFNEIAEDVIEGFRVVRTGYWVLGSFETTELTYVP
jgi:hypothetical protein